MTDSGPHMEVADLGDPITLQLGREVSQAHFHLFDLDRGGCGSDEPRQGNSKIGKKDDTARQLAEQDALNQYQRARTNLDQTLGKTLETYDVNIEEAKRGVVAREPDLLPPAQKPPAPPAQLQR